MIIFLYGPDTYRSKQKLNEIIARYKEIHKTGLSFHVLEENASYFDELRNIAGSVSMLGEKKLVILKYAISSKEFSQKFMDWKAKDALSETNDEVYIFYEGYANKSDSMFTWLAENAKSQEFEILSGSQLNKWAQDFTKRRGIKISQGALFKLLAFSGGDLWALENELQRLASYKNGGEIGVNDLDIFLRPKEQTHIFSFVDAVVEANKPKAFKMLKAHIEAGDNENYLFSMVYSQFRNIAQAQSFLDEAESGGGRAVNILGMHPYVAKKSLAQARQFGKEKIKKIYSKLVDLDLSVKTGKGNFEGALEELILSL